MSTLDEFKKNNPNSECIRETEHINLNKLWTDNTFMCRFPADTDFSVLGEIELPAELSAIFHKKEQKLEFIFAPLKSEEPFLQRKTVFFFQGIEFKSDFSEPSDALKLLASGFREIEPPGETSYRHLRIFRDYYRQDEQIPRLQTFFKDKKPYSFFIQGDFRKIKFDFASFCKHINVYLRFFDRNSPTIDVFSSETKGEEYKLPCYTNEKSFPEQISTSTIDPIALDLLQIAERTGDRRLKYLFYYQILEYFAYYYLDEELKRKLTNIISSPDIISNSSAYTRVIIEELKDYSNNTTDKHKLTRLISDYITIDDISIEIKSNIKNFSHDVEFDGGFRLPSIISDEKFFERLSSEGRETKEKKKEKEKTRTDLVNTIADRVERIRNVLVHIRESRENKVILPTKSNNRKLVPYTHLLRRISETIAIKYKM